MAVLIGPIRQQFDISDFQYSLLHGFAFSMFYIALGLPIARLADRRSVAEWQEAGSPRLWDRAAARVRDILAEPPTHLDRAAEARIRTAFPIHLPE